MSTKDYVRDLELLHRALSFARTKVSNEISDIREKQRARARKPRSVSDHAVVRYLERTGRVDIEAVRAEVNALVEASESFKKVDGVWHSELGMVFIVEDGVVVTVLSTEQSEKYLGSDLLSGGVAERLDDRDAPVTPRHRTDPIKCPLCGIMADNPGQQYRHMLADHADQLGPVA